MPKRFVHGYRVVMAFCAVALLLAPGCRLAPPDHPLLDIDSTPAPRPFSDRDETPGSPSTVAAEFEGDAQGRRLATRFRVADPGYGGVALAIPATDLTRFAALSFRMRVTEGSPPDLTLQWADAHQARKKAAISAFTREVGRDWTRVLVPLSLFTQHPTPAVSNATELAFILEPGAGAFELDGLALLAVAPPGLPTGPAREPYPARSRAPLPHGLAAWCYGDPAPTIEAVRRHNAHAPPERRIRYLFPLAGSLWFNPDGTAGLHWDPAHTFALADALGAEVQVHPMVDGLSRGAHRLDARAWDDVGRRLADAVNADARLAGLHLDIEPHEDVLYRLFARTKAHTRKPVSAAVGIWSEDTFRYTDFAAFMSYDWATDPADFARLARERVPRFLRDAAAGGGRAFVGVPAIATHLEYEATASRADGPREASGHRMADYVDALLSGVRAADPAAREAALLGISIWAFHPPGGLHGPRDTKWYFPTGIDDATWTRLRGEF
jgi:hypothetical protein